MKQTLILIAGLLFFNVYTIAQNRIITGKVIDKHLEPLTGFYIEYGGSRTAVRANSTGQFSLSIPVNIRSFMIKDVGLEPASIELEDSCAVLELVLLGSGTHDFITLKKADKLRLKEFNKLPALHLAAFRKGIFRTSRACYEQHFLPYYSRNKNK